MQILLGPSQYILHSDLNALGKAGNMLVTVMMVPVPRKIENKNHRIIECLGWEGTLKLSNSNPTVMGKVTIRLHIMTGDNWSSREERIS